MPTSFPLSLQAKRWALACVECASASAILGANWKFFPRDEARKSRRLSPSRCARLEQFRHSLRQMFSGLARLPSAPPHTDHPTRILIPSSGENHPLPRKGYQQDALFAVNRVELSPVKKSNTSEGSTVI